MRALPLLLSLIAVTAYAGKKVDLKPESAKEALSAKGDPKNDPNSATPLVFQANTKEIQKLSASGKVRVKGYCIDDKGYSYKQGEAGYENCLSNDKTRPPLSKEREVRSIGIDVGHH